MCINHTLENKTSADLQGWKQQEKKGKVQHPKSREEMCLPADDLEEKLKAASGTCEEQAKGSQQKDLMKT